MAGPTRGECLHYADALDGVLREVDDDDAAELIARRARQWREQAADTPLVDEPKASAADYVESMAADLEAAAVHLLASPHRTTGAAQDDARIRRETASNLRHLVTWLRSQPDRNDTAHVLLERGAEQLVALSRWIDAGNAHRSAEAVTWGRLAKLAEENGEVIAAYIGATGQNPRKGTTHTIDDVVGELYDVALTALAAAEHLTDHRGEALPMLLVKIAAVAGRAGVS